MMSIVYIDESDHSNKELRQLKQVVSHTEGETFDSTSKQFDVSAHF